MTFFTYSCFALPLWAVFFTLFFRMKRQGLKLEAVLAKCGGTFLALAGTAPWFQAAGQGPLAGPLRGFFLLCLLADALIEIRFVPGMLLFGAAHLLLGGSIVWAAAPLGGPPWWALPLWAAGMCAALVLFRRELRGLGKLLPAFVLYAALLSGLLALGLSFPAIAGEGAYWPLAAGTLCFYLSDMMVAKGFFAPEEKRWEKPCMALYWGALYLIRAALWA